MEFEAWGRSAWEKRRRLLPEGLAAALEKTLSACGPEEKKYLQSVLATLPLSDLADYEFGFFLRTVRHALRVREEFAWCRTLPEQMFFLHVLYPRINNEELADCRELFYRALRDRVCGLSAEQAILEVNRWCAEQAAYRSTDDRTASALQVFECGFGRCGEESVFAVNALRSVGLCARQVYAPRWSHCDDNHAWVEAYDGKAWRYLGACEPEPELDRGWFTDAASRAMMIHTRYFLPEGLEAAPLLLPDADPAALREEEEMVLETVTGRYGAASPAEVAVVDDSGAPAEGAEVSFSILNFAGPEEIAVLKTGHDGAVRLPLGSGSVFVTAFSDHKWASAWWDRARSKTLTLTLRDEALQEGPCREKFLAPAGNLGFCPPLTREQKVLRRGWLEEAERYRRKKSEAERESAPEAGEEILGLLSEKDRWGRIPSQVLQETMKAPAGAFPEGVEGAFLRSPRVGLEPLAPWRKRFCAWLAGQEMKTPEALWRWVRENIRILPSYRALPGTLSGVLTLKAGTEASRNALFCGLCRSLGIPARLSPADGGPEYWREGRFRPAEEPEEYAFLTLRCPSEQEAVCRQNCSLSLLKEDGWHSVDFGTIPAGGSKEIPLVPGQYLLLTTCRLPSGDQLVFRWELAVRPGERREIALSFRQGKPEEMLQSRLLPPFSFDEGGKELSSRELFAASPCTLLLWLETGREPTEHILNELRETAGQLRGCQLAFVLEHASQRADPTLEKALQALPGVRLLTGEFADMVPVLARRMAVDPEKLPLLLLADRRGNGLYSASGYNVGTAQLVLRLLSAIQ